MEQQFGRDGYIIVKADTMAPLDRLRDTMFAIAKASFDDAGTDPVAFFDQFHKRGLSSAELNTYRMKVINEVSTTMDVGATIFEAYANPLRRLLGPDVVVQRHTNIVIQSPGDPNVAPVHRDAPPNSFFEVVVWLPLVHCFGTKGMAVLNRAETRSALGLMGNDPDDYAKFNDYGMKNGTPVDIQYGEALIFWTGVVHAIPINAETTTRWSINLRYKNFFAPYGKKGLPDFFRILHLSPLTQLGIEGERLEIAATAPNKPRFL